MIVRELEFNGEVIGYRASNNLDEVYDISLQSAQELHIYPLVTGPRVQLKQHNGLLMSDEEVRERICAEDLSNIEMSEKAKLKFLRKDPLIDQPLKVAKPDEPLITGFTYVLDISSEGAFDLANIRIIGNEIHCTNISLVSDPEESYLNDSRNMPADCLYSKYMDQLEDQQSTMFYSDMVPGVLTADNIWSRYDELYELWAIGAEEGDRVVVYEPDEYNQYYGESMKNRIEVEDAS